MSDYGSHASTTPLWKLEKFGRAWEAEDFYEQRDVVADERFPPEHLAEVARRFKAWRAMHTESLFVYLMVPRRLSEGELDLLIESGVRLVADVSWVL